MAYTQDDLDAIDKAIKQGVRLIKFGDKHFEFRTIEEMYQIRKTIFDSLNPSKSGAKRKVAQFSKGTR